MLKTRGICLLIFPRWLFEAVGVVGDCSRHAEHTGGRGSRLEPLNTTIIPFRLRRACSPSFATVGREGARHTVSIFVRGREKSRKVWAIGKAAGEYAWPGELGEIERERTIKNGKERTIEMFSSTRRDTRAENDSALPSVLNLACFLARLSVRRYPRESATFLSKARDDGTSSGSRGPRTLGEVAVKLLTPARPRNGSATSSQHG